MAIPYQYLTVMSHYRACKDTMCKCYRLISDTLQRAGNAGSTGPLMARYRHAYWGT